MKKNSKENNKEKEFDPYIYIFYESDMARCERIIKRQWVLMIILSVGFILSNILWFILT